MMDNVTTVNKTGRILYAIVILPRRCHALVKLSVIADFFLSEVLGYFKGKIKFLCMGGFCGEIRLFNSGIRFVWGSIRL